MRTPLRPEVAFLVAALAATAAASTAHAAAGDATAYRAHANALCRTFTPKLKRYETDLKQANATGDAQRVAFDLGALLGMTIVEDAAIEGMRVPPDAAPQMARPLKLLRGADGWMHKALAAATAGNEADFVAASSRLAAYDRPLNTAFDGAGLRDCGSNQA